MFTYEDDMGFEHESHFSSEEAATEYMTEVGSKLTDKEREAVDVIVKYGGFDGSHHKDWTMDQALRVLLGDEYTKFIDASCWGEDGPGTYWHEEGTPP